jgi:hypothetical protein
MAVVRVDLTLNTYELVDRDTSGVAESSIDADEAGRGRYEGSILISLSR